MQNQKNRILVFIAFILFYCCSLMAQKNTFSLSSERGNLQNIFTTKNNSGLTFQYDRNITSKFSIGVGVNWQFPKPVSVKFDNNNSLSYNVNQFTFSPTVKWFFSNKPWGRFYAGAMTSYHLTRFDMKMYQNNKPERYINNLNGFGAGLFLGYRYETKSGFGFFVQKNADVVKYQGIDFKYTSHPRYSFDIGVSKSF
jgi:hypothetical protein